MARLPTKKPTEASEPLVHRVEEWQGFTRDAPVKVATPLLQGKHGYSWVFRCHATNTVTGAEWIEVYGGNAKHQGVRSFKISEVTLIPPKRRRKR